MSCFVSSPVSNSTVPSCIYSLVSFSCIPFLYLVSPRVVSCRVVSCRVVSCRVVSCLVLSCLVLSCLVLSCLVLSCLVLSCLVLSCLVLSCLVLSCLVLSCLVLSCLVLSCLVLSCLVLSCLVLSCALSVVLCRVLCLPRGPQHISLVAEWAPIPCSNKVVFSFLVLYLLPCLLSCVSSPQFQVFSLHFSLEDIIIRNKKPNFIVIKRLTVDNIVSCL